MRTATGVYLLVRRQRYGEPGRVGGYAARLFPRQPFHRRDDRHGSERAGGQRRKTPTANVEISLVFLRTAVRRQRLIECDAGLTDIPEASPRIFLETSPRQPGH